MRLVEQHIIKKNHRHYKEIDHLSFLSKNLYNAALYLIRQEYFKTGQYLNYYDVQKILQNEKNVDYEALPRKVSQQVLKQVDKTYVSFFEALKSYAVSPEKFQGGRPRLPYYKEKLVGRNMLVYTNQAISKTKLKQGIINPSGTAIEIKTAVQNLQQVRIIKQPCCYVVEVIYEVKEKEVRNNNRIAAIDLGLSNLAAITNNVGIIPIIVNGRPLKSINQFYNKTKSKLQSLLPKDKRSSNNIRKLTHRRNNKVKDYLHNSSRYIINFLVSNDITTLVIGYNPEWKQGINIGKRNNQNFVNIPFYTFIKQLEYKAKLEGINVLLHEESYTSKCSFLDLEKICKHEEYKGKRVKRGLFRSACGRFINADVNGSYNIMRKAFPEVFNKGIEGIVVCPLRVNPHQLNSGRNKIP